MAVFAVSCRSPEPLRRSLRHVNKGGTYAGAGIKDKSHLLFLAPDKQGPVVLNIKVVNQLLLIVSSLVYIAIYSHPNEVGG